MEHIELAGVHCGDSACSILGVSVASRRVVSFRVHVNSCRVENDLLSYPCHSCQKMTCFIIRIQSGCFRVTTCNNQFVFRLGGSYQVGGSTRLGLQVKSCHFQVRRVDPKNDLFSILVVWSDTCFLSEIFYPLPINSVSYSCRVEIPTPTLFPQELSPLHAWISLGHGYPTL